MIFGYARISRPQQSIERQIRNIKKEYDNALIIQEAYSGIIMDRPEWVKLFRKAVQGDMIVFDSVSRMSRSADEGVKTYFELYERGVSLVFLKEHYIDTCIYSENMRDKIELRGTKCRYFTNADILLKVLNVRAYEKLLSALILLHSIISITLPLVSISNYNKYFYQKVLICLHNCSL